MKTQTIDIPALSVRAAVGSINEEARTVELIFSTGAAVDRVELFLPWPPSVKRRRGDGSNGGLA